MGVQLTDVRRRAGGRTARVNSDVMVGRCGPRYSTRSRHRCRPDVVKRGAAAAARRCAQLRSLVTPDDLPVASSSTCCRRHCRVPRHDVSPTAADVMCRKQITPSNVAIRHLQAKVSAYRRGNARRHASVEILSVAAQLYERSHFKRLAVGD